MLHARAQWAMILAGCVSMVAVTHAAGIPGGRVQGTFVAQDGWSSPIPKGWWAAWQQRDAACTQDGRLAGVLTYYLDNAEAMRLDVYCDSSARTPVQWAKQELAQVWADATTSQGQATAARIPAVVAELGKTPQRHPQRAVVFRLGTRMAHLTCQLGAAAEVSAACSTIQMAVQVLTSKLENRAPLASRRAP